MHFRDGFLRDTEGTTNENGGCGKASRGFHRHHHCNVAVFNNVDIYTVGTRGMLREGRKAGRLQTSAFVRSSIFSGRWGFLLMMKPCCAGTYYLCACCVSACFPGRCGFGFGTNETCAVLLVYNARRPLHGFCLPCLVNIVLNIIPTLYEVYIVSVHRMVMENRPVYPGSIQGSHRPISFIRIKHRRRADDILCKTEY